MNLPTGCLWWDTLEAPVKERPALDGDTYADVAIVRSRIHRALDRPLPA